MAWSLQRTFADQFFSMVAEEATNELRYVPVSVVAVMTYTLKRATRQGIGGGRHGQAYHRAGERDTGS